MYIKIKVENFAVCRTSSARNLCKLHLQISNSDMKFVKTKYETRYEWILWWVQKRKKDGFSESVRKRFCKSQGGCLCTESPSISPNTTYHQNNNTLSRLHYFFPKFQNTIILSYMLKMKDGDTSNMNLVKTLKKMV